MEPVALDGAPTLFTIRDGTREDDRTPTPSELTLTALATSDTPADPSELLTMTVIAEDKDGQSIIYEDQGFDSLHPRWVGDTLAATPAKRRDALENLFALIIGSGVTGFDLHDGLFGSASETIVTLTGGNEIGRASCRERV